MTSDILHIIDIYIYMTHDVHCTQDVLVFYELSIIYDFMICLYNFAYIYIYNYIYIHAILYIIYTSAYVPGSFSTPHIRDGQLIPPLMTGIHENPYKWHITPTTQL